MGVTIQRLPHSMVSMEIEVPEDQLVAALQGAMTRLSAHVTVEGFEPGEAPPGVVEQLVGKSRVLQEALDDLVPQVYEEAVDNERLDPVDLPEVEVVTLNPLVLTATVAVRPTVSLDDYRARRVPRVEPDVSDAHVDEELDRLRRRFVVLEPVDRPIRWGDTVRADVALETTIDGAPRRHRVPQAEFRLEAGVIVSFPGFAEQLIGLERGAAHACSVVLPGDFETAELAGQQLRYDIAIREVKQERLLDLDDPEERSLLGDVESADQIRDEVGRGLRRASEQTALADYHDQIVELLVAAADTDYPQVLIEREIDRLVDERSEHASQTAGGLQRWLEAIGQTLDELRADLAEEAERNLRSALVLEEFAIQEQIDVSDAQVDARLSELANSMLGVDGNESARQQTQQTLDTVDGRLQVRTQLVTQAALDRLTEICSAPS